MIKPRVKEAQEVDITPMIDIVFQLIIFFMVVMAIAVVYGVAIKFPPLGRTDTSKESEKIKRVVVTVGADRITTDHTIVQDGVLKLNGEEIPFTRTAFDAQNYQEVYRQWAQEREEALDYLEATIQDLILSEGYASDIMIIQGDVRSYHGKIMNVIDRGKRVRTGELIDDPHEPGRQTEKIGIDGFSLVPPER